MAYVIFRETQRIQYPDQTYVPYTYELQILSDGIIRYEKRVAKASRVIRLKDTMMMLNLHASVLEQTKLPLYVNDSRVHLTKILEFQ